MKTKKIRFQALFKQRKKVCYRISTLHYYLDLTIYFNKKFKRISHLFPCVLLVKRVKIFNYNKLGVLLVS